MKQTKSVKQNQLTPLSVRFHAVMFYCAYANLFLDDLRIFYLTAVSFSLNLFISLRLTIFIFFCSIFHIWNTRILLIIIDWKFQISNIRIPFAKKNFIFKYLLEVWDWFKDPVVVNTCQMQTYTRRDFKWLDYDEGSNICRAFMAECRRHLMCVYVNWPTGIINWPFRDFVFVSLSTRKQPYQT